MNSVQDAEGRVSNFPYPANGGCGQLDVTLKDIVSGICTVQEDSFLTDWNDFFYNDAKLGVSDEMGKLFVNDSLIQMIVFYQMIVEK